MSRRNLAIRMLISAKDEASGVLGTLRSNAGKVAAAIAGYFGIKMFAGAISSAADFQEQMSVVQAITKATAEEMELLKKAADEAGATTRYSATEAAQALESLARAGLSARESVETLPAVLALAQGNGLQLGQAAGFITQAVRGMGLEFSQSARVADVLSKAAASANTTVEGLGNALSYAAPTANALGLSLEETVAIIAKFADAGIDASRAGTALNSILAQFSDPASKFRQEMAGLGIYTTDFYEAIEQLSKAGPEGQKAIRAVGLEAGPALQALLSQGVDSLKELREGLQNASGSAQTAADTMDGNLNGVLRGLGSVWDAVKRTLVDPLLDPITEQVNRLTSRLRSFISEGVVQRAGEILASIFTAAQQSVNKFLDDFDLDQVVKQLKGWLDQTKETVDVWLDRLKKAGDTSTLFFNIMGAGINTIKATILSFGSVASQVMYRVVDGIGYGMSLLGVFSKAARDVSNEIRFMAAGLNEVSQAMYEEAGAALSKATENANEAREAYARLSEQQNESGLAAGSLAESFDIAAKAESELAMQSGITADQLDALGGSADYLGESANAAADGVNELKNAATDSNEELAKAQVEAARLAYAYEELGITSQAALEESAQRAKNSFDAIKSSGKATARELQQAFQVYAQRAVAANNGVASHALKAEAAQLGLKLQVEETGRVIVESMRDAALATADAKRAADEAGASYRRMAQDAKKAGDAKKAANEKDKADNDSSSNKKERVTKSGGTFKVGKYSMSDLKELDEELAKRAAEAIADVNKNLTSWGGSSAYRKERYEAAMRNIEQAAKSIETQQEAKKSQESTTPESTPAINALDELAKTMEQKLNSIPQPSKVVRVEIAIPGRGVYPGLFGESDAEKLVRELKNIARVSK